MQENYTVAPNKPSDALRNFFDILESFVYAIAAVVLIFVFFGRLSVVDGQSMDDTLSHGEYLVVGNIFFGYTPDNGDIVVIDGGYSFYPYTKPIVKRVIATGGQTLEIDFKSETVYVDGIAIEEDYAKYTHSNSSDDITHKYHNSLFYYTKNLFGTYEKDGKVYNDYYDPNTGIFKGTIPKDHIFVMGDNRLNSADSRISEIGFVHENYVVGKAVFRLFPFSSFGGLY